MFLTYSENKKNIEYSKFNFKVRNDILSLRTCSDFSNNPKIYTLNIYDPNRTKALSDFNNRIIRIVDEYYNNGNITNDNYFMYRLKKKKPTWTPERLLAYSHENGLPVHYKGSVFFNLNDGIPNNELNIRVYSKEVYPVKFLTEPENKGSFEYVYNNGRMIEPFRRSDIESIYQLFGNVFVTTIGVKFPTDNKVKFNSEYVSIRVKDQVNNIYIKNRLNYIQNETITPDEYTNHTKEKMLYYLNTPMNMNISSSDTNYNLKKSIYSDYAKFGFLEYVYIGPSDSIDRVKSLADSNIKKKRVIARIKIKIGKNDTDTFYDITGHNVSTPLLINGNYSVYHEIENVVNPDFTIITYISVFVKNAHIENNFNTSSSVKPWYEKDVYIKEVKLVW